MHILTPRKELIVPRRFGIGMEGWLRLQCIRPDGRVRYDTGFFRNTLLTAGLNELGTRTSVITHCQVGTDNTAASPIQTSLLGHVAGTNSIQSTVTGQASTAPYFGWKRNVYRFAAGTVAANLNEVGVGWDNSGSTLLSRALILDPTSGNPTTVTPLADELLDVTYELRYYAPTSDVLGPQGNFGGTLYDTTTRAAIATDNAWSSNIGLEMKVVNFSGWSYTGALGAVTASPSGIAEQALAASYTNGAYSNNSLNRDFTINVGVTEWNRTTKSVRITCTGGVLQCEFDNGGVGITKTSSQTMTMTFNVAWAARP